MLKRTIVLVIVKSISVNVNSVKWSFPSKIVKLNLLTLVVHQGILLGRLNCVSKKKLFAALSGILYFCLQFICLLAVFIFIHFLVILPHFRVFIDLFYFLLSLCPIL